MNWRAVVKMRNRRKEWKKNLMSGKKMEIEVLFGMACMMKPFGEKLPWWDF
jgi:hypothetical protein